MLIKENEIFEQYITNGKCQSNWLVIAWYKLSDSLRKGSIANCPPN